MPHQPGYPVLVTVKGTAACSKEGVCLDSVAPWGLSRRSRDQSELLVVITAPETHKGMAGRGWGQGTPDRVEEG